MELAEDILDRGGALEVWSVELAQRVLDKGPPSHGKCGELAQHALGCEGALETRSGRRRIYWAVEAHWRPGALSRHHLSWTEAHFRMASAGSWHSTHRAVDAYWRHSPHHRKTWCLPGITLPTVSTGSWLWF